MIQKPRGTRDFLMAETRIYQEVETLIRQILKNYHFQEIQTPIMESAELFMRGVGETSDIVTKEMYQFPDKKGRLLVLRPEGTAPMARAILENKLYLPEYWPLKVFYSGPMFRYERPQTGRYRQFHQIGVELYGDDNPYQLLELVHLIKAITDKFKLTDKVCLEVNFLPTGQEREIYLKKLQAHFQNQKSLCQDCQERMVKNPLRILDCKKDQSQIQNAPNLAEVLTDNDLQTWTLITAGIERSGLPWVWNSRLVRGLDYYTGFVFELKLIDSSLGNQNTILAGGSYHQLFKQLGNISLKASGFALGLDRFVTFLQGQKYSFSAPQGPSILTIPLSIEALLFNEKVLNSFRQAGISAVSDYSLKGFKHGFKMAETLQAENLVFIGSQEVETQILKIKNQKNGEIKTLPWKAAVKFLSRREEN